MKYVLFVCTHNAGRCRSPRPCSSEPARATAGRSPQGLTRARQVWPEVVEVMREIGVDLSGNKPKRLSVEMQLHADWAVTMGCGDLPVRPDAGRRLGHPRPRRPFDR